MISAGVNSVTPSLAYMPQALKLLAVDKFQIVFPQFQVSQYWIADNLKSQLPSVSSRVPKTLGIAGD